MKKLNVVHEGRDWKIVGFADGSELPIEFFESESGNHNAMLSALNNSWEAGSKLEKENEVGGGSGLVFYTPFGVFATYSFQRMFQVEPVEEIVAEAHKLDRKASDNLQKISNTVLSAMGFDAKRLAQIEQQYGNRLEDWPRNVIKDYQRAYAAGSNAARAAARGDIDDLITEELCRVLHKK